MSVEQEFLMQLFEDEELLTGSRPTLKRFLPPAE